MTNNYPFRNLVFKGGGILGIAYLGAIEVLGSDSYNILNQIERVSGASAGAITAMIVSLCETSDEIIAMADSLDFTKVPQKKGNERDTMSASTEQMIEQQLQVMFGARGKIDLKCLKRLLSDFGWYSSEYLYNWLRTQIQSKFDQKQRASKTIAARKDDDQTKGAKGLQTFQDFKNAGFKDLYVSVANVTKHTNEILSYENAPNMPVADAVRMSMSIPLYFEAIKYNDDYYADGGLVNGYPMEVFDDEKYMHDKNLFNDGINLETLGCHLYEGTNNERKIQVKGLIDYIMDLVRSIMKIQQIKFNSTPNLVARSADINDCGFSAVDFDIKKGDAKYNKLYQSGKDTMIKYLQDYNKQDMLSITKTISASSCAR